MIKQIGEAWITIPPQIIDVVSTNSLWNTSIGPNRLQTYAKLNNNEIIAISLPYVVPNFQTTLPYIFVNWEGLTDAPYLASAGTPLTLPNSGRGSIVVPVPSETTPWMFISSGQQSATITVNNGVLTQYPVTNMYFNNIENGFPYVNGDPINFDCRDYDIWIMSAIRDTYIPSVPNTLDYGWAIASGYYVSMCGKVNESTTATWNVSTLGSNYSSALLVIEK